MSGLISRRNIILIVIICCINISNIRGQQKKIKEFDQIELKEFYDTKGVILPSDYVLNTTFDYKKQRFTPTIEEIARAEQILSKIVNMILGSYTLGKELARKNMRSFYRQYMGIFKENQNKLILISLLDFSNPETSDRIKDLRTRLIMWFDGPPQNYIYLIINIDTGEIDELSNPLILDERFFLKRD